MNTLSRLPRKVWIVTGAIFGVLALLFVIAALTPPQHQEPYIDNSGEYTHVAYHSDGTQWFLLGAMMGMHSNYYGMWHHDYYSPTYVEHHYHYYSSPSGSHIAVSSMPPTQVTPMHAAPRMGTQGSGTVHACGHGALPPNPDYALMAYHQTGRVFLKNSGGGSHSSGGGSTHSAPAPGTSSHSSSSSSGSSGTHAAPAPGTGTSSGSKTVKAPAPGGRDSTMKPSSVNC